MSSWLRESIQGLMPLRLSTKKSGSNLKLKVKVLVEEKIALQVKRLV